MTYPVRIQLSRRKGFDLQATSRAYNGREVVVVARPTIWGNPFTVKPHREPGVELTGFGRGYFSVPTVEDAVACYRVMLASPGETAEVLRARLPNLRGKNLACWCNADEPCHADVLLDLANREVAE